MTAPRFILILSAVLWFPLVSLRQTAKPIHPQIPKAAALSPSEKEAQDHYRVALVALKNDDLDTARDELKRAADLAPNNAVILYNLAVVESKKGDPESASSHLSKAKQIGLPQNLTEPAEQLSAELTYKARKATQQLSLDEATRRLSRSLQRAGYDSQDKCMNRSGGYYSHFEESYTSSIPQASTWQFTSKSSTLRGAREMSQQSFNVMDWVVDLKNLDLSKASVGDMEYKQCNFKYSQLKIPTLHTVQTVTINSHGNTSYTNAADREGIRHTAPHRRHSKLTLFT